MLPIPPNRLVPPSTTAEIVDRLSMAWPPIVVVAKRGRHHGGEACERARQHIDRDELAPNLDSCPPRSLLVRADGEHVNAEAGEMKDDCADKSDGGRNHDKDWNACDHSGPDRVDQDLRDGGAVREDLGHAQRHAEGAKRDDAGGWSAVATACR